MSSFMKQRKPLRDRNQILNHSKQVKRKKRPQKPAWDDTVKDLSVFKPSPQEIQRNHDLHQPRKDHERLIRKINTAKYLFEENDSHIEDATQGIYERKKALIKEVFRNQEKELQEILHETDRTLADVKDIFGDDATQKFQGKPHVTKAPCYTDYTESFLSLMGDNAQSKYDETANRTTELNLVLSEDDMCGSDIEGDVDNERRNYPFESKIDLKRYQDILSQHRNHDNDSNSVMGLKKHDESEERKQKQNTTDIQNVQKVREDHKKVHSTSTFNTFNDLQQMLRVLEDEISEYERETEKKCTDTVTSKLPSTLTGYTTNLLSAVIRITRHLKESENQLRAEMAMRKEILDVLDEQRSLVDALTVDLLQTQEENETLRNELETHKKSSQTQYASLKIDVTNLERRLNQMSNILKSQMTSGNAMKVDSSFSNATFKPSLVG